MYDQLLRASDSAMKTSSFFHPLVLQGKWVKKKFLHPCSGYASWLDKHVRVESKRLWSPVVYLPLILTCAKLKYMSMSNSHIVCVPGEKFASQYVEFCLSQIFLSFLIYCQTLFRVSSAGVNHIEITLRFFNLHKVWLPVQGTSS